MAVGGIYDGAVAAAHAADPAVGTRDVVIPVVGVRRQLAQRRAPGAGRGGRRGARARRRAGGRAGRAWRGRSGHWHGVLRLEGRGRHGEPAPPRRGCDRRRHRARELRSLVGSVDRRRRGGPRARPTRGRAAIPPGAASSWWRPTRRSTPPSPDALRAARASGSRGRDRWRTTSGEIFLAFAAPGRAGAAAAERGPDRPDRVPARGLGPFFAATAEATQEAVLNALWHAADTTGRDGRTVRGLPHDDV